MRGGKRGRRSDRGEERRERSARAAGSAKENSEGGSKSKSRKNRGGRFPVFPFLPKGKPGTKGKRPRAHNAAFLMGTGTVWYMPNPRTAEVIEQCAAFPYAAHDDLVDCVTSAIEMARRPEFIGFGIASDLPTKDEADEAELLLAESRSRGRRLYGGESTGGMTAPQAARRGYGRKM